MSVQGFELLSDEGWKNSVNGGLSVVYWVRLMNLYIKFDCNKL